MVTLKDIKKIVKTKSFKESVLMNKRIRHELKKVFKNDLTKKEYDDIMWIIPDYNPKDEKSAVMIGYALAYKYKTKGVLGGKL